MNRAGFSFQSIAKISGHVNVKSLTAQYDTTFSPQSTRYLCRICFKISFSVFANAAVSMATGASHVLGAPLHTVKLQNRKGIEGNTSLGLHIPQVAFWGWEGYY